MLDSANIPSATDFAVTVDEASVDLSSNSPVSVRGRTVMLGLANAVTSDQDVTLSYTDPTDGVDDTHAIQDPAGNDAATLTDQAVTNASTVPDERAPEFVSAATTSDGLKIVLTFDEDLDSQHGPRTSDFAVTVQGERRTVASVGISGTTVTLDLGRAISSNESVAVVYTDPTAGVDDRNAIQDSVGNDAASLTEPVTNNSTVADAQAPTLDSAETSTDGGRIVLTFSEVLDSGSVPSSTDFTVTVDGETVDLSSTSPVIVRGRTVILGLDTAVTADQSITFTYTDVTDGDDSGVIQDPAGNDVATIADHTVTNRVGQRPTPPATPGTPSSTSTTSSTPTTPTTPTTPSPDTRERLEVTLTVSQNPAQVGHTLTYTVTVSNTGAQQLTGLIWRDTSLDPASAWQSLPDLAAGASTTASGSFGLLQSAHIPYVIVTVRVDSDQTDERVTSEQVAVVAASTESPGSPVSPQPATVDLAAQQPVSTPTRPRVPSTLVLRVVRVLYEAPDVHLAHNIPDLLLTLPDGSETTCDF